LIVANGLRNVAAHLGENDSISDFRVASARVIVIQKTRREPMKTMSRAVAFAAALGCANLACGIGARAQDYPSRPITMIVPFPAGGPTDTLGRILGEGMRASFGQPVIIENVTGAGSTIGVTRAAQAAPDGYTLVLGNWTSFVGSGALYRTSYDLLRDFEPISLLTFAPMLIVGKNALPVKDARELIAWLKANPDKASVASVGAGSAAHVCGLYFQDKTNTRVQFVPYRGGAPAMQDLVGGQIDLMCAEASQTLTYVRGGKMKAFAVMSQTKEVLIKLNGAVMDTLADPIVRQRLTDLGQVIATREQQTPAALAAYHKAEIEKWWPIIRAANIKVEAN
jgi:tripartite-type tricarboxylate transporter receptor subunit TctC